MADDGGMVMIEGQRAREIPGLPKVTVVIDGARGNGGLTQRFARMQYVVTGQVPARIEVGPRSDRGDFSNLTLSNRCTHK